MDHEQHARKPGRATAVAHGWRARAGLGRAIDALDDMTDLEALEGTEREAVREALGLALAAMAVLNVKARTVTGLSGAHPTAEQQS